MIYHHVVLQTTEENPEVREEITAPSLPSMPVIPSISPTSNQPSERAISMTTEELCTWLKKHIKDEYIELFEKEEIDGSELAIYSEEDLEHLVISVSRIRKKILIQFRKIPNPTPTLASTPSLVAQPSDTAINMTTEELCTWLKEKHIEDEYVKLFEEERVDGSELAAYSDEDLKDLGVSISRIRKKILIKFRKV